MSIRQNRPSQSNRNATSIDSSIDTGNKFNFSPVLKSEQLDFMKEPRSLVGAVSAKDVSLLKEILEEKDEPNQQNQMDDALMLAVKMRQPQMVEELLNAGADVHAFDESNPILLTAIGIQALDIFELLVPMVKDVQVGSSSGNMMHAAVRTGDVILMEQVYKLGVDINFKCEANGATPLHEAVKCARFTDKTDKNSYNLSAIDFLISNVSNIDATDEEGKTPLHEASIVGNQEVVEHLLDAGASRHSTDESYNAPFMYALQYDHEELADLLTDGVNLHISVVDEIYYAHIACKAGNFKTLRYLMLQGVDMSVKDHDRTPLMTAIGENVNENCIFTLLKSDDCGVNEVTDYGSTPLDLLMSCWSEIPNASKILELLVRKGADVNRVHPKTGCTPLLTHIDDKEVTNTLLALGANINFISQSGDNALLQACLNESHETLNLLVEHGINMALSDEVITGEDEEEDEHNHKTALQISILNENKEIIELLLCAGCSLRNIHGWIEESEHCDILRKEDPYYQKVFSYIESIQHGPRSLQYLSRLRVLQAIGTENCVEKIDKLDLPEKIKNYLPWSKYYAYRKNQLSFNV